MEPGLLTFLMQTAGPADIRKHLLACDQYFMPPLSQRVDIEAYTSKIIQHATTFEAWNGKQLTGLLACYFDPIRNSVFITTASVLPEWRGCGIANKLFELCEDHAKMNNFKEITLEVSEENKMAQSIYVKRDYTYEESKRGIVKMKKIIN